MDDRCDHLTVIAEQDAVQRISAELDDIVSVGLGGGKQFTAFGHSVLEFRETRRDLPVGCHNQHDGALIRRPVTHGLAGHISDNRFLGPGLCIGIDPDVTAHHGSTRASLTTGIARHLESDVEKLGHCRTIPSAKVACPRCHSRIHAWYCSESSVWLNGQNDASMPCFPAS